MTAEMALKALFAAAERTGYETPEDRQAALDRVRQGSALSFPHLPAEEALATLARHQADRLAAAEARVADAITSLRAENEALIARVIAAEAALAEQTAGAQSMTELAQRYRARLKDSEAALAAAMAVAAPFQFIDEDYDDLGDEQRVELRVTSSAEVIQTVTVGELRRLAALEPNPAAQDREAALIAAIRKAIDLLTERTQGSLARSPGHNARLVLERALATQPHTDALAARDAKMRAEGMRQAADMVAREKEVWADPLDHNQGTVVVDAWDSFEECRDAILAAAQKEAEA